MRKIHIFAKETCSNALFRRHIEKVMECHAVELTSVNLAHLPSVHSNAAGDVHTRYRAWTDFANLIYEAMREPTGANWTKRQFPLFFCLLTQI